MAKFSGLRPKLNAAERAKFLVLPKAILNQVIISRLSYIGETFVVNSRLNGTYRDITGNLRSSTGYIVLFNGKVINQSEFEIIATGEEGSLRGQAYADELASKYPIGYALICVAGMNYAFYVEAKGRDVITASSLTAKADLLASIEGIKQKLKGV